MSDVSTAGEHFAHKRPGWATNHLFKPLIAALFRLADGDVGDGPGQPRAAS